MLADITWNGISKTYRVGKVTFKQNRTGTYSDRDVIDYCKNVKNFTVTIREEVKAGRPKKEVEEKVEEKKDSKSVSSSLRRGIRKEESE